MWTRKIIEFGEWEPSRFCWNQPPFTENWNVVCGITKASHRPIFSCRPSVRHIIDKSVDLFIASLELQECFCWFQQDGATAHTETITFYANSSGIDWFLAQIGRLEVPVWYFQIFSFGGMPDKIFRNLPNTMDELKLLIIEAINATEPQTLRKIFCNMQKRRSACLLERGSHFEHMI